MLSLNAVVLYSIPHWHAASNHQLKVVQFQLVTLQPNVLGDRIPSPLPD